MKTLRPAVYLLIAVVVWGIALLGCSKDSTTANTASQVLTVKTGVVEGRAVERSVEATGALAPWEEVIVSSEAPGAVATIAADLGDTVKTGVTLATLDQREAKLNLADASASHLTNIKTLEKEKARVTDARTNLKRYEDLYKNAMVSQSQFDSIKTLYAVTEAQYKEAEGRVGQSAARLNLFKKRLSDTVITAPIDGEIKKRFVSVGEAVRDKSAMFTVVSTGRLKFRAAIAGTSVSDIAAGQTVRITVDAFAGRVFEGALKRISPAIDAETRTLEVEAVIPNRDRALKPGFFAKGVIITKKESGVPFVPEGAVYSFVGVNKIFVIADGLARERRVNIGMKSEGMLEVLGNIAPGETVAISNLSTLFDGARVNVSGK
ncbi:MAG: efflux RND transporter periplasmic adaptor subunit [Deltaproteobacteria bacterium]|nr:efflux RND transporter periplasmic adaptor subunit [Deltaproteobacteria bacterium]